MDKRSEDKLERFVRAHRSDFDREDPPQATWDAVARQIRKKPKSSLNWVWKVAAILFFGMTIYLSVDKFTTSETMVVYNPAESFIDEFQNVEQYYSQIINIKKAEIEGSLDFNDPLNSEFKLDIDDLDRMYSELQKEYKNNTNEQVVDAMIRNLQIQIAILDKQLQIIQNLNNLKKSQNEGIKI